MILEMLYTGIETLIITLMIFLYFGPTSKLTKINVFVLSYILIFGIITLITAFSTSWIMTMFSFVISLALILTFLYNGKISEKFLIAFLINSIIAIININTFTFMSKITGVDYQSIAKNNDMIRFTSVMITKVLFFIASTVIVTLKKRHSIMLKKAEVIMIVSTMIISGILLSIVRNLIYKSTEDYELFLIIVLCILLLNILQYFIIVYISQKNKSEKNISLMEMQIEMQKNNISDLEKNYAETAKLRHDFNNYISCAIELAGKNNDNEVVKYLSEFTDKRIKPAKPYVILKRSAIGAVVNSKLSEAKNLNIQTKCIIQNELDDIDELDLAILLANLLDNAIEACVQNKDTSDILLKIWCDSGFHCMELSNTIESDVLLNNPNLKTSKKDSEVHGIGLQTIKDIVSQNNGIITFKQKDGRFFVYISIPKKS